MVVLLLLLPLLATSQHSSQAPDRQQPEYLTNDVATCNHTQIYISASSVEDPKHLCLLKYAMQHCQQADMLISVASRLIQTDIQLLGQVATTSAFSTRSILQSPVADLHQEMSGGAPAPATTKMA